MTADQIEELLHATPFVPFTISMANGRKLTVDHPDFASLSRGQRVLVVNEEGDVYSIFDLLLATRVETTIVTESAGSDS
ncbi:MAG: hypothetical protein M3463_10295 [Verrucomicrobiota bacterium]|nr:hypothetical protein [Verrucomicrobiota bacterium]